MVFVHGLQGDLRKTWTNQNGGFWPAWLAEDNAELAVWSVGYEATVSGWSGTAMPLFDRANNILAELQAAEIGNRPICWVTHSMGGLLVKQMLRNADTLAPEFRAFSAAIRCVVFTGTPHTGSDLAGIARYLGFFLRSGAAAEELQALSSPLLELNTWYRENHRRLGVTTQVFFENQATEGVRLVDHGTADPGLEGVIPIGLDADHFSICKPSGREDLICKRTQACILGVTVLSASKRDSSARQRRMESSTARAAQSLGLNPEGYNDAEPSGHPAHLSELDAVITAYNAEINLASSYLKAGLSLLIRSDRLLFAHLAAEIGVRSGRQVRILNYPNVDRAGEPNPGRIAPGRRQDFMVALHEALTAAPIEAVVIVPYFGTLASASEDVSNAHTHELTELLYERNDRIILAFTDPSVRIPPVLANRFAIRLAIDILPRTVLSSDGRPVPIGQALITKAEAALFEGFNATELYPHIAGMNAVRLRDGMRFAYYHCTANGADRQAFANLLQELRVFKARTANGFEISNVPLDAIGGYDEVKAEIAQALKVLADAVHGTIPAHLSHDLVPKGFLFHGPPGTGKTLFAQAIASQLRATICMVSGPEIIAKYAGDTERQVHDLFAEARRSAPAVLVFNEFDAIASRPAGRDDGGSRTGNAIVAQLLIELDGFRPEVPVLVIGTTNRVDLIDEALLRPSRFRPVKIGLPDEQDRRAIAMTHAQHFQIELTSGLLDNITAATEGMNGDEIRSVFRDARAEELVGGHPANAQRLEELISVLRRLGSSRYGGLASQTTRHSQGAAGAPIMRKPKVFISYVREDSAMIDRIAETLRIHGIDAWLDRTHIAPGERWQQAIRNAIREGHCFIACFSPSYAQRDSTYMNEELRIATEQLRLMPLSRRWFIPVILKTCRIPDFPIDATDTLGSFQCIDFSHDWDSAMAKLIDAVSPKDQPE